MRIYFRHLTLYAASTSLITWPVAAQNVTSVINNADLKTVAIPISKHIQRLGYSTVGDGGFARYNWSNGTCPSADNGAQVSSTSSSGGCWIADFAGMQPTPMIWGAVGTGASDDQTYVQNAINALQNRVLYLGNRIYRLNSSVTSSGQIQIIGNGGGQGVYSSTCISGFRRGATGIVMINLNGSRSTIENACFDVASGVASNVNDTAIKIVGGINSSRVLSSQINDYCIGVEVSGIGSAPSTQNIGTVVSHNVMRPLSNSTCPAVRVGAFSVGGNTVDTHIERNEILCPSGLGSGVNYVDSGGVFQDQNDIYQCNIGTWIKPGANQFIIWGEFSGVAGDTSTGGNLIIDTGASSATINGLLFNGAWASAGTAGTSVLIQDSNASNKIQGLHFSSSRFYLQGAQTGFDILAGSNISIRGSTICGDGAGAGVGIRVRGNAGQVHIQDNRIGQCDNSGSTAMAIGVEVSTTNGFVGQIIGNDIASTTTPLSWAAPTNATAIVKDNIGVDNFVPTVTAAATVSSPNPTFIIVGSTAVKTVLPTWSGRQVTIIPSGSMTLSSGGNLCNATSSATSSPVLGTWLGGSSCWILK